MLTWLSGQVRSVLRLAGDEPVEDRTLLALGMESLQAIALQYQILDRFGADVTIDELLGGCTVGELARFVAERAQTSP